MLKKVAELKLNKNKDYYKETVKALEEAGFILVLIQISKSFKIIMLLFRYDDSFSKKKEWNHSEYVAKTKPLKVIF